jgi:hypothetical protein
MILPSLVKQWKATVENIFNLLKWHTYGGQLAICLVDEQSAKLYGVLRLILSQFFFQVREEAVIAERWLCCERANSPQTFFLLLETMPRSLELPQMLPVLH